MEHISPSCLEKYESILQQIDCEYKKYQEIKKQVEKENNKIVAANIALKESNTQQKLFQVKVKVFGSVFEMYDVLEHDLPNVCFQELSMYKNHKFYLIEVSISQVFQTKMLSQNWLLNVCVKNSKYIVNQSIMLTKLSSSLCTVVPFDNSLESCVVETFLTLPSDSFWPLLKLQTVNVDISYHFESNKDLQIRTISTSQNILNILKLYSKGLYNINSLHTSQTSSCMFYCKCSKRHYIESLLKNCYHRLDSDLYFNLHKCNDTSIKLQLTTGDENKTLIEFNTHSRCVQIVSKISDLYKIKRHLINELKSEDMLISKNFYPQLLVSNF